MSVLIRLVVALVATLALGVHARSPTRAALSRARQVEVRSTSGVSRRVTGPARVARVVRWFDALPIDRRRGVFACPFIRSDSPTVTFAFLGADGSLLARATVLDAFRGISGVCNPIRFSVGDSRPHLLLGGRLLLRVQRLLGVRFG
jgi:hypothetical protein